ncbi:hypothetical protein sphantq_02509 [Sphingobium sp. AntQ-1]|nr:hypothetical protein sphantq_02509 [Sphingobium sp. AntQ-1]
MHLCNRQTASTLNPGIYDIEDPLGMDEAGDLVVTTTRRAISRIAFVAAETASRFERESIEHDPMAWLFAPRRIFEGQAAIDACLERNDFQRAILLHGLSLGLDADREEIDDLLDDDEDELSSYHLDPAIAQYRSNAQMRLYSATIDHQLAGKIQHGFHASMASSMGEFRSRVADIFGTEIVNHAVLREGVNPKVRMVEGLVAPEVLETLVSVPSYSGRRVAVTAERIVELDS